MAALRQQADKENSRIRRKSMSNYFRVTAHYEKENISFIADSNGKFEKLWQFSSYLVKRGCKIVAISTEDKFLNGNIKKVPENAEQFIIRACAMGTPTKSYEKANGVIYPALRRFGNDKRILT